MKTVFIVLIIITSLLIISVIWSLSISSRSLSSSYRKINLSSESSWGNKDGTVLVKCTDSDLTSTEQNVNKDGKFLYTKINLGRSNNYISEKDKVEIYCSF